jgi:hypothetical protein
VKPLIISPTIYGSGSCFDAFACDNLVTMWLVVVSTGWALTGSPTSRKNEINMSD